MKIFSPSAQEASRSVTVCSSCRFGSPSGACESEEDEEGEAAVYNYAYIVIYTPHVHIHVHTMTYKPQSVAASASPCCSPPGGVCRTCLESW